MPLVLSDESTKHMSDEQLLLQCVKEYADPGNYELYEKDYGVGRFVERMPAIATGKGCHARRTLEVYNERKNGMAVTPMQSAYLGMHKLLDRMQQYEEFEQLPMHLQDEILRVKKEADKWL